MDPTFPAIERLRLNQTIERTLERATAPEQAMRATAARRQADIPRGFAGLFAMGGHLDSSEE